MDPEKLVVASFIFLLLGGSLVATVWAIDTTLLPAAVIVYFLIGFALLRRIKQAKTISSSE